MLGAGKAQAISVVGGTGMQGRTYYTNGNSRPFCIMLEIILDLYLDITMFSPL